MNSAVIGSTGFVGSNLVLWFHPKAKYNSKNIQEIRGQEFDLLICAGTRAEKWKINHDPLSDLNNINSLISHLDQVTAKRAILISTVDVYPTCEHVDEDTEVFGLANHAYGFNRANFEKYFESRFDTHIVVRLPALYGTGLKKNAIYDLINNNEVEKIDSRGVFQFYFLDWLWKDLCLAMEANIPRLNLVTQPISICEIAKECFGMDFDNQVSTKPAFYDIRSKHTSSWRRNDGYLYGKNEVIKSLRFFVDLIKST